MSFHSHVQHTKQKNHHHLILMHMVKIDGIYSLEKWKRKFVCHDILYTNHLSNTSMFSKKKKKRNAELPLLCRLVCVLHIRQ